jgi:hypothetical protein
VLQAQGSARARVCVRVRACVRACVRVCVECGQVEEMGSVKRCSVVPLRIRVTSERHPESDGWWRDGGAGGTLRMKFSSGNLLP